MNKVAHGIVTFSLTVCASMSEIGSENKDTSNHLNDDEDDFGEED
jgi:hypothetical protein